MRTLQSELAEKGLTEPITRPPAGTGKHEILILRRSQEEIQEKPDCLFCNVRRADFAAVRGNNIVRCCYKSTCQKLAKDLVATYPY